MMQYYANSTNKRIQKTKRIIKIILLAFLALLIVLTTLFFIDVNRMRNNEPVFFSTWGYSYAPPIDIKEDEIEHAIIEYVIEKGDNEPTHHENEKTFASMRVYLLEEIEKDMHYNIYAWVVSEKYYLENDEIKQDSGSSIPYKFVVEYIDGEFVVTDSRIPRDGSYYTDDMKNIFPSSVRNDMDEVYTDGTIERLQLDIEQQTTFYFHK